MTSLAVIMFSLSLLLVATSIYMRRAATKNREEAEQLLEDASRSHVRALKMLDEARKELEQASQREDHSKSMLHQARALVESLAHDE